MHVIPKVPAAGADSEAKESTEARVVPSVAIDAFCETDDLAGVWRNAAADRRMSGARVQIVSGGIGAAIQRYRNSRTPDLVVIESAAEMGELLPAIDALADECSPDTKVVVIGHRNDVTYYRELLARGVSDYLVVPIDVVGLSAAIARICATAGTPERSRIIAFMGGRGGAGSSMLAHNCAWLMASRFGLDVLLGDVDLAFGTAGLDFNLEGASSGGTDPVENGKLEDGLMDHVAAKPHERLSVLAPPAALDGFRHITDAHFGRLVGFARARAGCSVLDVPHMWTSGARELLGAADDIVMVATPDLASLRNTKMMLAYLKQARPNDSPPLLVLNQVGVPRRPEIKTRDFAQAAGIDLAVAVPFDPHLFGTAANNGKMLDQVSAKAPASRAISQLAEQLAGGKTGGRSGRSGMLARLLGRGRA